MHIRYALYTRRYDLSSRACPRKDHHHDVNNDVNRGNKNGFLQKKNGWGKGAKCNSSCAYALLVLCRSTSSILILTCHLVYICMFYMFLSIVTEKRQRHRQLKGMQFYFQTSYQRKTLDITSASAAISEGVLKVSRDASRRWWRTTFAR